MSPVIGTILIIAITIVLVSMVGAVLMGFGTPEAPPILGIKIASHGNMMTITHLNGAVLPAGHYKILVEGINRTANFGATGDFSPGVELSWNAGTDEVGTITVIYTGDKGFPTLLADKKIGNRDPGIIYAGGKAYNFMIIPTPTLWSDFVNAWFIPAWTIVPEKTIFNSDGKNWYNRIERWVRDSPDDKSAFTIQYYINYLLKKASPDVYTGMMELLVDEPVLTPDDYVETPGPIYTFKPEAFNTLKCGKLFTRDGKLYVYTFNNLGSTEHPEFWIGGNYWVEIGTASPR
ncbi:MAG TPA: type IV pilin N-terminal domain-containing protein [Methanocorpusculum sp.]|nr:type IV pilin N-terminal domain-containing protein [Methanocorpusculum sp.]HJJ52881.1 type IV pilin N-terminal domain-containing protein [Methanocorpusculum sp.]HKL97656.1 type IV pilin N-terminal domain-containing protein [Methanocorpusculum sp.]